MKRTSSPEATGNGTSQTEGFCRRLASSQTDPQTAEAWKSLIDDYGLVGLSPQHGPAENTGRMYNDMFHALDTACAISSQQGGRKLTKLLTEEHRDKNTGEVTNRLITERTKSILGADPNNLVLVSVPSKGDESNVADSAEFSLVPPEQVAGSDDTEPVVVTLQDLASATSRYDAYIVVRYDESDEGGELSKIKFVAEGISTAAARHLDIDGVPISLPERKKRAAQEGLTYEELMEDTDSEYVWADLATAWRPDGFNLPALLSDKHNSTTPSIAEVVAARKQLDGALAADPEAVANSLVDETGAISYTSMNNFTKRTGIDPRDLLLYGYGPETSEGELPEITELYTSPVMPDQERSVTGIPVVVTLLDLANYANGSGRLTLNPDQAASEAGIAVVFNAPAQELVDTNLDKRHDYKLELTARAIEKLNRKKRVDNSIGSHATDATTADHALDVEYTPKHAKRGEQNTAEAELPSAEAAAYVEPDDDYEEERAA